MPKPWKDPEIQNKIKTWVENNPSRWFTATYKDIHVETDVSLVSVYRYYRLIVARVANILPSEVEKKRQEKRGLTSQQTQQKKIRQWVKKNPSRWFTACLEDVHVETGVSLASLHRYFSLIVARVANILPSEVIKKRQKKMGIGAQRFQLSDEGIAEIQRLYNEGNSTLDIAFITGKSLAQCEKYKPKKQTPDAIKDEGETSQSS